MQTTQNEIATETYVSLHRELERLVREPERKSITGVSRPHWARLEAAGRAPKRIQVSDRIIAWKLSDLRRWVELVARGEHWTTEAQTTS